MPPPGHLNYRSFSVIPQLLYPRQENNACSDILSCADCCDTCDSCRACCSTQITHTQAPVSTTAPNSSSLGVPRPTLDPTLVVTLSEQPLPTPSPSPSPPSTDSLPPVSISSPGVSIDPPTNTSGSSPASASKGSQSLIGPIVGGVVGGLILISLAIALIMYYRRRNSKRHVAPSTEFLHRARLLQSSSTPAPESDDEANPAGAPPPFTPGTFNDPIFEKLSAAAQQRQEMEQIQLYHQPYQDDHDNDLVASGAILETTRSNERHKAP